MCPPSWQAGNSADADGLQAQSRACSLLASGTGAAQAFAAQGLVTNREIEAPGASPLIFAAALEGCCLIMRSAEGRCNQGAKSLHNALMCDVSELARQAQSQRCREPAQLGCTCLLTQACIFHKMSTCVAELLPNLAQQLLGEQGVAAPLSFVQIREALTLMEACCASWSCPLPSPCVHCSAQLSQPLGSCLCH